MKVKYFEMQSKHTLHYMSHPVTYMETSFRECKIISTPQLEDLIIEAAKTGQAYQHITFELEAETVDTTLNFVH